MNIFDWIQENKENIIKIVDLEDIKSKSDPCEQPYRSQYAARDILQSCITELDEKIRDKSLTYNYQTQFLYLNLSYRLANNFISTEERHPGEEIINVLCEKIEVMPSIRQFLDMLPQKVAPTGDNVKSSDNANSVAPAAAAGETDNGGENNAECIRMLAGILIKIYNSRGMLWASRIMNNPITNLPLFDDSGVENSMRYLGRAKSLYNKYKQLSKTAVEDSHLLGGSNPAVAKTELCFNYEPPECLDSFLLDAIQYESSYLINECNLTNDFDRKRAVKFDVFESDYTTTLFLLAQTFGKMSSKAYFKHKSAKYCYWTLARQLNALKYDPVEWAINAATLSQYYVTEKAFHRARHCIAASQVILREAVVRPTPGPTRDQTNPDSTDTTVAPDPQNATCSQSTDSDVPYVTEPPKATTATGPTSGGSDALDCSATIDGIFEEAIDRVVDDVRRQKLTDSENPSETDNADEGNDCGETDQTSSTKKKLLPDPMSVSRMWEDDVYEEKRVQGEADIARCWINYGNTLLETSNDRLLPDYNPETEKINVAIDASMVDFNLEVSGIETQVSSNWITTFEDARNVFLFTQKKIIDAKKFYTIDFRCSDYVELVMDHSKTFKALTNFEYGVERKCCMHKKRIDMLLELLNKLNQEYYLVVCRKMMLEIGEIYNSMAVLKTSLLEIHAAEENLRNPSAQSRSLLQKIKRLSKAGVDIYQRFLETYRDRNGVIPDVFSEDDIRPVLIAHFYIARLLHKSPEADARGRVEAMRRSLQHYRYIVEYCDKHAAAARLMAPELESCRDMVVLLPCKIDKVIATL